MKDSDKLAQLIGEVEGRLGRPLTDAERLQVLRIAGSELATEATSEAKTGPLGRAWWTILSLLIVAFPVTLWGIFVLLDWASPSILSSLSTVGERFPLVVFALASSPFVSILALLLAGAFVGGGGSRSPRTSGC